MRRRRSCADGERPRRMRGELLLVSAARSRRRRTPQATRRPKNLSSSFLASVGWSPPGDAVEKIGSKSCKCSKFSWVPDRPSKSSRGFSFFFCTFKVAFCSTKKCHRRPGPLHCASAFTLQAGGRLLPGRTRAHEPPTTDAACHARRADLLDSNGGRTRAESGGER